uniref:Uncharacterized protein n=1 Tax=Sphaerodactylus townsendi TaxID=933632 RepID=A0ACB8FKD2_9SAUR
MWGALCLRMPTERALSATSGTRAIGSPPLTYKVFFPGASNAPVCPTITTATQEVPGTGFLVLSKHQARGDCFSLPSSPNRFAQALSFERRTNTLVAPFKALPTSP